MSELVLLTYVLTKCEITTNKQTNKQTNSYKIKQHTHMKLDTCFCIYKVSRNDF